MVLPLIPIGAAALGGSALIGGWLGKGKKDCSTLASEKCSKGGVSELWKGEQVDWECYTRVYNDCIAEREGVTAKLSPQHKDVIIFGAVGLLALGLIGKYDILGGKNER
jgi:hypothetical protein